MCDETVWKHQQTNLSDLAEIIIPNFRGFDSLTAMAESVLEQAPGQFAVAGHSMGGRVALEVFNFAPEKIIKLGLLETGAHPLVEGEKNTRQSFIDLARTGGMDAVADEWLLPMIHPKHYDDTHLLESIRNMIIRTSVEDFIKQVQALINRPDATKYLDKIECDTLLVAGRHDSLYPVEKHKEMLAVIKKANLVIVEDAGHMATMEKPEEVTNALRNWLMK